MYKIFEIYKKGGFFMGIRINEEQVVQNKTGFSLEKLKQMGKQELLNIFDRNKSGTISDKEIIIKGIEGGDFLELRSHLTSVGIEKEVEKSKSKPQPKSGPQLNPTEIKQNKALHSIKGVIAEAIANGTKEPFKMVYSEGRNMNHARTVWELPDGTEVERFVDWATYDDGRPHTVIRISRPNARKNNEVIQIDNEEKLYKKFDLLVPELYDGDYIPE